jgi:ubiquinone/menaquinone biosynthesis C-methylase UbiE
MTSLKESELYICPKHKMLLKEMSVDSSLRCETCGTNFPSKIQENGMRITSFEEIELEEIKVNSQIYDAKTLNERYRNFLNWLFATFKTNEYQFRKQLFSKFKINETSKILITSVGNGDDILSLIELFPNMSLEIYAQDLSPTMCEFTNTRLQNKGVKIKELNISNLSRLPYKSNFFDLVFHFGGINWIQDRKAAISEMVRVAKDFGQIGLIDESVGSWLRNHEYGKMMIKNNSLWSAELPLSDLPINVNQVSLEYVLENCFYFLKFIKDPNFPNFNADVKHIGPRGGSIKTRYLGKLEGIDPKIANLIKDVALKKGISQSELIEKIISKSIAEIE